MSKKRKENFFKKFFVIYLYIKSLHENNKKKLEKLFQEYFINILISKKKRRFLNSNRFGCKQFNEKKYYKKL